MHFCIVEQTFLDGIHFPTVEKAAAAWHAAADAAATAVTGATRDAGTGP